ncbi:MAG: acetoin utilization protein AcuC [Rhodospirillaceae bacterium]
MAGADRVTFIGSDVYRRAAYGDNHPLSIGRVGPVIDLCRQLGWLSTDDYAESPAADLDALCRFHAPAYVDAVIAADRAGKADQQLREAHGLGTIENPVFRGLVARAAPGCGGSILAAELLLGGGVAYNPAGGTHHGRPDRASGFCYFNDPVLAILRLLDAGLDRVFYLDLDAHHGDGVEAAFADDARVATLSIHEQGRWPGTGTESRPARGIWNVLVPAGFTDSELAFVMEEVAEPVARAFRPDAVVVTCGADGLAGDPLSAMALTNGALWTAVGHARDWSPRMAVLGGGGYNPWTVVRCWAGLWASLAGRAFPETLPTAALDLLAGLDSDLVDEDDIDPCWLTTIADEPNTAPVRPEVRDLARRKAA